MRRLIGVLASAVVLLGASAGLVIAPPHTAAFAHDEREAIEPDGSGAVPTYRTSGPTVLVCKKDKTDFDNRISAFPGDLRTINLALWNQCQTNGFQNLQEAVNGVKQAGSIIKI